MEVALKKLVRERAENRCEYCHMHQEHDPFFTFPIDHIIALQHHGPTEESNLCLSCFRCNSHKGPNLSGIDPDSGSVERLFHPREDHWDAHFEWQEAYLVGKSAKGRATVDVLAINQPDSLKIREALIARGDFP